MRTLLISLIAVAVLTLVLSPRSPTPDVKLTREVTGLVEPIKKQKQKQLDDIAFTLFAEDRSNKLGMAYVLSVIINRAKSTDVSAMHATVLKRKQFSCWERGKRVKQRYSALDRIRYTQALALVEKARTGRFKPLTVATHYYNPKKVTPYWRHQYRQIAAVNSHVFLIRATPSKS